MTFVLWVIGLGIALELAYLALLGVATWLDDTWVGRLACKLARSEVDDYQRARELFERAVVTPEQGEAAARQMRSGSPENSPEGVKPESRKLK